MLIESVSRIELLKLREENEKMRKEIFQQSFVKSKMSSDPDAVYKCRKNYIDMIYLNITDEIALYKEAQDMVLKVVKINDKIWNLSMEEYLPSGEQYIKKALKFSLQSPFTFDGRQSLSEVG